MAEIINELKEELALLRSQRAGIDPSSVRPKMPRLRILDHTIVRRFVKNSVYFYGRDPSGRLVYLGTTLANARTKILRTIKARKQPSAEGTVELAIVKGSVDTVDNWIIANNELPVCTSDGMPILGSSHLQLIDWLLTQPNCKAIEAKNKVVVVFKRIYFASIDDLVSAWQYATKQGRVEYQDQDEAKKIANIQQAHDNWILAIKAYNNDPLVF